MDPHASSPISPSGVTCPRTLFTQVLVTIVPGLVLEKRGHRMGKAPLLK